VVAFGALVASRTLDRRGRLAGAGRSWVPLPVLAAAHLAGAAALALIVHGFLDAAGPGRRLLWAYLLPYAAAYAVMAVSARRAGRQGRAWAREEWLLQLTGLCLAPVLSAGTAPLLERGLGLDPHTALVAGVSIGCGVLAFAATTVVSLRVMYAREVLRRTAPVAAPAASPVGGTVA
ncbi:DUF2306 domain-containing protein, partial [Streptomyces sp. NPDC059766]